MTVKARRVASVPKRTPTETWGAISDLVASSGSPARRELDRMVGLASMLIADECTREDPIIIEGAGPQLRIYTLHGDASLEDDKAEAPFAFDPTAGNWTVSFPCSNEDLEETQMVANALPRVEVRPMGEGTGKSQEATSRFRPVIDLMELERE